VPLGGGEVHNRGHVTRDPKRDVDWLRPAMTSGRVWMVSLVVWTSVAALTATVRYAYYFERHHIGWWPSLAYSLADAILWAFLTPPLLAFGAFLRLDRETWPRLPIHLAVVIVVPVLYWFPAAGLTRSLEQALGDSGWGWELTRNEFVASYLLGLVVSSQILAVSQGLVFRHESRARALRESRLEADLARAQLQLLRAQLEPHFLFNTLHAIATLMRGNPAAAERMTLLLSDLLRRALRERDENEVPLREELEFLDRYIEIEQVRFRERLVVERQIQPESLEAMVPPLLLHPLVENAIRHGLAQRVEGGCLGIRARREDDRLELRIWDDGPGPADGEDGLPGSGIGLTTTRARLEQLYGAGHRFELRCRPMGGVEVAVSLPFRTQSPSSALGVEGQTLCAR
jgi:two-component system LytT family sensor kinase